MSKFRLSMDCDNAAFEDAPYAEIGCILTNLIHDLKDVVDTGESAGGNLYDVNGNKVGEWSYHG